MTETLHESAAPLPQPSGRAAPPPAPSNPPQVPSGDGAESRGHLGRQPDRHLRAANRLAAETLLRCWIREQGLAAPASASGHLSAKSGESPVTPDAEDRDGDIVLDLPAGRIVVPVDYWSAAGLHRLGVPRTAEGKPVGPADLARMLAESAGARRSAVAELTERTVDSATRIAAHLEAREADPAEPVAAAFPFLAAEQSLLAGHPLHPTPKSRDRLSGEQSARFSPELRGSFPLHWFAVESELVAHDSELGPSAPALAAEFAGELGETAPAAGQDAGEVFLVPAHPWQAEELMRRETVRRFVDRGLVTPLGPAGPPWYPTSSVRTVYRPDAKVMLKLSLALNITNSRRENLRKELLRGVEAHRLFAGELGTRLMAAHPTFRILTDAAYLAVDGVPGLDASFRHATFAPGANVRCVAALTDLGRGAIAADGHPHELAAQIHRLSAAEGRPVRAVALDWFSQYVTVLILPLFWLDAEYGVTLEGHQQNTLLHLDADGYPGGGWYRDNQGVYYRESAVERLEKLSGLLMLGRASDTIVADAVVSERLVYYVGVNNLLGMVGAMGYAGLADERALLGLAVELLSPLHGHPPVGRLLDSPVLRSKANLLTRAAELDELVGDLATQSVYVEVPNPFAAVDVRAPIHGGGARPTASDSKDHR